METWFWSLIALSILLGSLGLLLSHVRTWRATQASADTLDARECDFRRRQYRRRLQTTLMLAVVAMAVLIGPWLESPPLPAGVFLVFWCVVLLLVVWLMALAAVDILATKLHYNRVCETKAFEKARLQAERHQKSRQHDEHP